NHLVLVSRRELVWKDANLPRIAVAPDFGRRVGFMAGTKRTTIDLLAKRVRARSAIRGDDDCVAGDRIPLDHGRSILRATANLWAIPSSANASRRSVSHSGIVTP